jgi:uncharacterized protein (DUF697 family)
LTALAEDIGPAPAGRPSRGDEEYDGILRTAAAAAGATGPLIILPVPGADMAAIAGIWTTMAVNIAQRNGHTVEGEAARRVILAVAAGSAAYWANAKLVMWFISKIPGIGMAGAAGVNGGVNALSTLWLGFALIDLFEQRSGGVDLEFSVDFLVKEMRPRPNGRKLKRLQAFSRRWANSLAPKGR